MMEHNVYEYISNVNYKDPDFSIAAMKEDLKKIIGVKPSVKVKWKTTERVNELLKNAGAENYKEIVEKAEEVSVVFAISNEKNGEVLNFKFMI